MKKKNIVFITVLLVCTIILSSCEFFLSEPDEGEGRIILIGVGLNYVDTGRTLYGTLNDIKLFSSSIQSLSEKEGKDFYWLPLMDQSEFIDNGANYATKENIENAIDYLEEGTGDKPLIINNPLEFELSDSFDDYSNTAGNSEGIMNDSINLNSNDILIFQYSGHGKEFSDSEGDSGALVLRSKDDTSLIDYFNLVDLYDLYRDLPCKSLIILDSCFSGNAIPISDTTISTNDPRVDDNWFKDYFDFLLDDSSESDSSFDIDDDIFILTAATSNQESYEMTVDGTPIGAFTYSLLQSLGCNIDFLDYSTLQLQNYEIPAMEDESISLDNIYEYVKEFPHDGNTYDARVIGGRYDLVLFDF